MTNELIVVFGGSGFIGRHVIKALTRKGYRVRAALRRPHVSQDIRVLGDVGQIQLVQANVRFPASVDAALEGADGVVNLVGIGFQRGKQTFAAAHVGAAEAIGAACQRRGITRIVQLSALGADPGSKALYARSKAEAEAALRRVAPQAVILRPSIVFGPEDSFFNRFAEMARFTPLLPLIGGAATKLQPVHVCDLAEAVVAGLSRPDAAGRTFEIGGPRVYTFRELMDFTLATIRRPRGYLPLPFPVAGLIGGLSGVAAGILPFIDPPITSDQVELLRHDNIVGASGDKTLGVIADLGVTALETIEVIVPTYLWRFRPHGQFEAPQGT